MSGILQFDIERRQASAEEIAEKVVGSYRLGAEMESAREILKEDVIKNYTNLDSSAMWPFRETDEITLWEEAYGFTIDYLEDMGIDSSRLPMIVHPFIGNFDRLDVNPGDRALSYPKVRRICIEGDCFMDSEINVRRLLAHELMHTYTGLVGDFNPEGEMVLRHGNGLLRRQQSLMEEFPSLGIEMRYTTGRGIKVQEVLGLMSDGEMDSKLEEIGSVLPDLNSNWKQICDRGEQIAGRRVRPAFRLVDEEENDLRIGYNGTGGALVYLGSELYPDVSGKVNGNSYNEFMRGITNRMINPDDVFVSDIDMVMEQRIGKDNMDFLFDLPANLKGSIVFEQFCLVGQIPEKDEARGRIREIWNGGESVTL